MPNFQYINNELVQLTDAEEAAFKSDQDACAADKAANGYKVDREREYPSVVDQLDQMYHFGFQAWKDEIQKVKEKYPKP